MFPLSAVLFPHMPLVLRVFEERYLAMLSQILQTEPSEFGVALIERGPEVGGGEQRFAIATVAQITQLDSTEDFVVLVAEGGRRVEVDEWLEDDPYPRASVRLVPELEWDDALEPLRDRAEQIVRRVIALASEFSEQTWPSNIELASDPVAAVWQLAAIAPCGELDQVKMLQARSIRALLELIIECVTDTEVTLQALRPGDPGMDSRLDPGLSG